MTETGEPLTRACELVGRFFYHFGRVDLQLDEAITKLFKLDPAYAPIITSNIDFVRKVNIVEAAVALQANSGKPISVDVEKIFGTIRGMNNPPRQVVAHSPFEETKAGVQFKRTVAKGGELKAEDPLWTETKFEEHFKTLQRLEGELTQIIGELEPDRIKWPNAASLAPLPAAYLAPAFFMYLGDATDRSGTPLALREAAGRASRETANAPCADDPCA
jgi:hypothetical protein